MYFLDQINKREFSGQDLFAHHEVVARVNKIVGWLASRKQWDEQNRMNMGITGL